MAYPTLPPVELCSDLKSSNYDAVVVVTESVESLADVPDVQSAVKAVIDVDAKAATGVFVVPSTLPAKRIVFSGTGALDGDYDDVRGYADAAKAGIARAIQAGARSPLLFFKVGGRYPQAGTVAMLGALAAIYVPLEMREARAERASLSACSSRVHTASEPGRPSRSQPLE